MQAIPLSKTAEATILLQVRLQHSMLLTSAWACQPVSALQIAWSVSALTHQSYVGCPALLRGLLASWLSVKRCQYGLTPVQAANVSLKNKGCKTLLNSSCTTLFETPSPPDVSQCLTICLGHQAVSASLHAHI